MSGDKNPPTQEAERLFGLPPPDHSLLFSQPEQPIIAIVCLYLTCLTGSYTRRWLISMALGHSRYILRIDYRAKCK